MRKFSIGAVAVGLILAMLAVTEAAARDRCDCGYFERPFTGRYWRGQPAYRYLARARLHRVARAEAAMPSRMYHADRSSPAGHPVSPTGFGR